MNISVIIPTHNRNDFLADAISSVMQQTFQAYEILIINNGENPVVLAPHLNKNVKIVDTVKNAGASQARNIGATIAQGEFLAFLDDDDLWDAKYLENVKNAIYDGAFCVISRLDQLKAGEILPYKNPNEKLTIENTLAFNPGITGSNIVLSKDKFMQVGGFDIDMEISHDKSLALKILLSGMKLVTLKDSFAIFRRHDNERLTSIIQNRHLEIETFIRKFRDQMTNQIYRYNLMKAYKYRFLSGERRKKYLFAIQKLLYLSAAFLGDEYYGNIVLRKRNRFMKKILKKTIEQRNNSKHFSF